MAEAKAGFGQQGVELNWKNWWFWSKNQGALHASLSLMYSIITLALSYLVLHSSKCTSRRIPVW